MSLSNIFASFKICFPDSSHLFPIICIMVTVSHLKRALYVDPNEPWRSSSSLMIHHQRIWVRKEFSGNETVFGGTNGSLKATISGY